jgi:hypothetical protein
VVLSKNDKSKITNQHSLIVNTFFFLDEKETKNQDLGFSAIKIGSLPKTQKLPRSPTRGLKQFEFLHGPEASGSPFCPDASGRLPNPMVEEVFGSALLVVGIWSRSVGIHHWSRSVGII